MVAFPLFIFLNLRKHKEDLDHHDIIIKYGLYYIGLKSENFYWEIGVV